LFDGIMLTKSTALLKRLIRDQTGQDLVEYALLTAVVGFAGAVAAPLIGDAIAAAYDSWVAEANDNWESPNPTAGP
jgi:Flp pilus assembly pilin Flp